jgi:hypothetical protein
MGLMKRHRLSDWYVPPDIALIYGVPFILIAMAVPSSMLLPLLSRARSSGDFTLLYMAFALGAVGIVLLALARMPLYRQRRFFTFGPRALDEGLRRLYRWAYRFIGASVLLMSLLLMYLK